MVIKKKKSAQHKTEIPINKIKAANKYAFVIVPIVLALADYLAVLCAEELSFCLRNLMVPQGAVLYISKFNFYVIMPVLYLIF